MNYKYVMLQKNNVGKKTNCKYDNIKYAYRISKMRAHPRVTVKIVLTITENKTADRVKDYH